MCQRGYRHKLCRLARRCSHGGQTSLESSNALFEDIDGGIHYPTVDVAKLFEAEQSRAMSGVIEGEGRCCIDGHSPCLGGRIGFLASMQLQSLEFLDIVGFLCGTHAET